MSIAPENSGLRARLAAVVYDQTANGLTVLRVMMAPVLLLVLWGPAVTVAARLTGLAVFALAAITDWYDGELARRRLRVSTFGKIADPIADKVIIITALVCFSLWFDVSWWATGLIATREVAVTVLRFAVVRRQVIAASSGGKLKTCLQMAFIGVYLVPLPGAWPLVAQWLLLWPAVLVTLVTGLDYFGRVFYWTK